MPEGFPRGSDESDLKKTSNKVIVYRTFDAATSTGPANALYHRTAVAMVAAGSVHESPRGMISGVAPEAWIGFYQVGDCGNDAILRAIEVAAAGGMDVINLSVAFLDFSRPAGRRPYELATEQAFALGSALVWGAGNMGPERATVQSHSHSHANLIAGGTLNSRVYAGSLVMEDGEQFLMRPLEWAAAAVSGAPVEGVLRMRATSIPSPRVVLHCRQALCRIWSFWSMYPRLVLEALHVQTISGKQPRPRLWRSARGRI